MLTRELSQSEHLARQLQSSGVKIVILPLLEFNIYPAFELLKRINLDIIYDAIIITSSVAARALAPVLLEHRFSTKYWFSVGVKTAILLQELGTPKVNHPKDYNSESLLRLILEYSSIRRVLLAKGNDGREYLLHKLTSAGVEVDTIECYKRYLPEHSLQRLQGVISNTKLDVIIITCMSSLQHLTTMLIKLSINVFQEVILLVISNRIAEQAKSLGWANVRVAASCSETAIITGVKNIILAYEEN